MFKRVIIPIFLSLIILLPLFIYIFWYFNGILIYLATKDGGRGVDFLIQQVASVDHGSDENNSLRPRCGIVLRYSPTDVKADLSKWPFFSVQHVRGLDEFQNNPIAPVPRGEATPVRPMQFHTEFESQW